jgi:1-pyrroline-5-carboxylate dehydrogenase
MHAPMRGPFKNDQPLDFSIPENEQALRAAIKDVETKLGKRYPIVIGGEERETGQWIKSINPADPDQVVGEVAKARKEDVEDAIQAAHKAFKKWRNMPAKERASVLFKLAGLMNKHRLELDAWMVYELDKPWDEADGEVAEAIDFLEWYGRLALKLEEPAELGSVPEEANELLNVPLGVGVVIPPWNFACAIYTGMTMSGVAAGNTVIVKPASNTPVIGYRIFQLMQEAGVPGGVVNFLPGSGDEVGDTLVEHPLTRYVAFTGSRDVGVRIYENAAKVQSGQRWLKRVVAEMGGKDAIIVDDEADLEAAAQGIVTSAFGFAGQKCSACSRAIIHQDVYDEVVKRVVELTESTVTVGAATEGNCTLGAVVDEKQYNSILDYLEIGKREGTVLTGGGKVEGKKGYYIQPTVIADVAPNARVACEEIFGPVVAMVKARDYDHALEIANDSEYGLTGSVYSRNREKLEQARREFDVGNLYFNRKCTGSLVGIHPFAGMKLSGTNSKAGGPNYLMNFVEEKSVSEVVNP